MNIEQIRQEYIKEKYTTGATTVGGSSDITSLYHNFFRIVLI